MKSEERHELKRNDLATGLSDLPGLWRRHGNKVLIVLAVAFLVLAAVRYKRAQVASRQEQTRVALATAWNGVDQLPQTTRGPASAELDKFRAGLETEINQSVQIVLDDTAATPTQSAWAWLARGELYWALAHATPAVPTTAPTSAPASQPAGRTPAEYLTLAGGSYRKVIDHFGAAGVATKVARFSLAALAEEQRDLATARTQYKALIETAGVADADKSMAEARLAKLDSIENPVLLLPATQPVGPDAGTDLMRSMTSSFPPLPAAPPASAPAATQPQ